jgi:hypothetical protein
MRAVNNKPAIKSKIHLSALIIIAINILALWGAVPTGLEAKLLTTVNLIGPVMIMVFRQWFTNSLLAWK